MDLNLSHDSTVGLTYGGQFGDGALDQSVRGVRGIGFIDYSP